MLVQLRMLKLSVGKGRQFTTAECCSTILYATVATESAGYVLYRVLVINFFGLDKDILYLCLSYVSPETSYHSASRDSLWNTLEKEIAKFSPDGHIVLTGDFNAKTGVLLDYIAEDSDQHIPFPNMSLIYQSQGLLIMKIGQLIILARS